MKPYCKCKCGCGQIPNEGKMYITGHNLRLIKKSALHRRKIGDAQRRSWDNGQRQRVPVGAIRIKNGKKQIRTLSAKGWLFWKNVPTKNYAEMTAAELIQLPPHIKSNLRKKGFAIPRKSAGAHKGYKQSASHIEARRKSQRKYLFDLRTLEREAKNRIRKTPEYKEWRRAVFTRDRYTCQECGAISEKGKQVHLEAHHIKSFAKYPKLRFSVSNGLTLCRDCHRHETHKSKRNGKLAA